MHRPLPLAFTIDGARVRLRAPRVRDAARLIDVMTRSADFLAPWSPTAAPDELAPRAVRARLLAQRREWTADRAYRFVVADRATDALLGRVSLGNVVRGVFQNAYVGYWIDAESAGRGLMTEALALAASVAFDRLGLHRLQAAIIPDNAASLALAARAGFRREGYAERYLRIAGRWQDHALFALTAEEWAARPRT